MTRKECEILYGRCKAQALEEFKAWKQAVPESADAIDSVCGIQPALNKVIELVWAAGFSIGFSRACKLVEGGEEGLIECVIDWTKQKRK